MRDVVDLERADPPWGESNCRAEYRLLAGERVGMDDEVLLRARRAARDGGSGVDTIGGPMDLSSGADGISSCGRSRDASCIGDMLTETEDGGVGSEARLS